MMAKSADRATASAKLALICFEHKRRIQEDINLKKLQIVDIEAKMSGLYRGGVRLTEDQAKSGLPMPHTSGPSDLTTKLTGFISWNWWWVLAPTWIPLAIVLVCLLVFGVCKLIEGK